MVICPNGHRSEATDYCDVCGAPIPADAVPPAAPPVAPAAEPVSSPASKACPNCGGANPPGALFCEACGYDFTTGSLPRGASPAPVVANPLDLDAPLPSGPATPVDAPEPSPVPVPAAAPRVVAEPVPAAEQVAEPVPSPEPEPVPAATPVPSPEPQPVPAATPEPAEPAAAPRAVPRLGGATAVRPATLGGATALGATAAPVPAPVPPAPEPAAPTAPAGAASAPLEPPAPVLPPTAVPAPASRPVPEPGPDGPQWRAAPDFARGASGPGVAEWVAEVWIDPDWYAGQDSPDQLPSPGLPRVVGLRKRNLLIGRPSKSRGIEPDVDCEPDTGVSRRHAELTTDGVRWWVEDLGSSNGTYVGQAGAALPDTAITGRTELGEDSRVYVGSWTRIVVRRANPDEADL